MNMTLVIAVVEFAVAAYVASIVVGKMKANR